MDIFDTLYLRTPANRALDTPLTPELTRQIGDYLVERTAPRGLAVRVRAVHMCKTHRGVLASHNSQMISSAYYGLLKSDERLKAEFLEECRSLEGRIHS